MPGDRVLFPGGGGREDDVFRSATCNFVACEIARIAAVAETGRWECLSFYIAGGESERDRESGNQGPYHESSSPGRDGFNQRRKHSPRPAATRSFQNIDLFSFEIARTQFYTPSVCQG